MDASIRSPLLLLAFGIAVWGCGGGARVDAGADSGDGDDGGADDSVDEDGDGAGTGSGCRETDCDDTDPATDDECGRDCEDHPTRRGCPCDGDPRPCYHGPEGSSGVGTCRAGLQACLNGVLGSCEDQQLPRDERCDDLDDDCDGEVDEDLISDCGTCGECEGACFGADVDCTPWSEGTIDRLIVTGDGALQLERVGGTEHVLWPSTISPGRLFKVDTQTRSIVGAYRRGPSEPAMIVTGSAVDRYGHVYVTAANLLGNGPDFVMKVAAAEESCIDRNANGKIDTSQGWDDVLAFDVNDTWEDECILWFVEVPHVAEALVLDERIVDTAVGTFLWVSHTDEAFEGGFVELDSGTGAPTGRELPTPAFSPFMARSDPTGRLWVSNQFSELGMFDPDDLDAGLTVYPSGAGTPFIEVDESGAIWLSGDETVRRFDPQTEQTEVVVDFNKLAPELGGLTPGHLVADGEGSIWAIAQVPLWPHAVRIDTETLDVEVLDFEGVLPWMVAVDVDRQVWFLLLASANESAQVFDLETGLLEPALTECTPYCIDAPGWGEISSLRTTFQYDLGVWSDVLVACDEYEEVTWSKLRARAAVPSDTSIELWVKVGRDEIQRAAAEWRRAGELLDGETELDLGRVVGGDMGPERYLAVQARMNGRRAATSPAIVSLEVVWGCMGLPE